MALFGLAALGAGIALLASSREPTRRGVTVLPPRPPITLTPMGRMLTPFEREVMLRYFKPETLDRTKLWFGRPSSSFAQEGDVDSGVRTVALATSNGIYFRFDNHELQNAEELALLAHEISHIEQFLEGAVTPEKKDANEIRAYQMQIAVKKDLDASLDDLKAEWQGARYA